MIKIFLKKLRILVLQNQREKILSKEIARLILSYNKKNIKILDYGSGFEPRVATMIYENLKKNGVKKIQFDCYDLYKNFNLRNFNKTKFINFYKICSLKSKKKYDFCLINDVLHHIGIHRKSYLKKLLIQLKGLSKCLIIKDHFQYGILTNSTLRFMDFIGNYYNDVNIPKKYFDKKNLTNLLRSANLKIIKKKTKIRYYSKFFLFFSNPKLHFIYVLK